MSSVKPYMKLKLLIFFISVIGLLMGVSGPFYFPNLYFRFCEGIVGYYAVKFMFMAITQIIVYQKFKRTLQESD